MLTAAYISIPLLALLAVGIFRARQNPESSSQSTIEPSEIPLFFPVNQAMLCIDSDQNGRECLAVFDGNARLSCPACGNTHVVALARFINRAGSTVDFKLSETGEVERVQYEGRTLDMLHRRRGGKKKRA